MRISMLICISITLFLFVACGHSTAPQESMNEDFVYFDMPKTVDRPFTEPEIHQFRKQALLESLQETIEKYSNVHEVTISIYKHNETEKHVEVFIATESGNSLTEEDKESIYYLTHYR